MPTDDSAEHTPRDGSTPFGHGGIGLIATDLDGTLLDSHSRISPRTRAILMEAHRRRIPLVMATGRPLRWMPPVWEQIQVCSMCVCMNGALVYDPFHQQVLRRWTVQPRVLRDVIESVHRQLPEVSFAVERTGADGPLTSGDKLVQESLIVEDKAGGWYEPDAPRVPLAALAEKPATKLLVRRAELSSAQMAEIICPLVEPEVKATYSMEGGLIEISHPMASKGEALVRILDYLDLSEETLLAFGDMPNDRDMLELAAWSVAVANAHPALQGMADEVTASNDDDGVAIVLERFLA